MKIRFKMENKSHKYDINRLALGMDTYIKYKMYLSTMKVIYIYMYIKQHLSNICSSIQ